MRKTIILFIILIGIIWLFAQDYPDKMDIIEQDNFSNLIDKTPIKWGDDILITSGYISDFDFAFDYNNNICYLLVDYASSSNPDTVWLFRSYDAGMTWDSNGIIVATNSNGFLYEPDIIVTDSGKVACFVIYEELDGTRQLYMREFIDSSLTLSSWETISNGTVDTVYSYDVDYQDGFYYVAYSSHDSTFYVNPYIFGIICHEDSSTWVNRTGLFANPLMTEEPKIAAAANGYAYVAFIENRVHPDTLNIRIKRTFDYGNNWLTSVSVSDNTTGDTLSNIDIAAGKLTDSRNVWITVENNSTGNWGYYYSTDSCAIVTYANDINMGTGWEEHLGTVEAHPYYSWATFALKADSGTIHNVVFFYIMDSYPTTELTTNIINDYNATNTLRPLATNITANSAIVYAGWGPNNLYFDSYPNTLFADNKTDNDYNKTNTLYINPIMFNDNTEIFFNSDNQKQVSIEIFNSIGRVVWNKHISAIKGLNTVKWNGIANNGQKLPSGIYFIRINTGANTLTSKVTLL